MDTERPLPPPPPLGPELEFLRVLWAVDHALQTRSKRMLVDVGVTGPQRLVLRIVGQRPGISAGELAGILHVHPSTLTGVLARLVAARLVVRRTDEADRRRALFELTPAGRRLESSFEGTVEGAVRRTLAARPPAAVAATTRTLELLASQLSAEPSTTTNRRRREVRRRA